MFSDAALPAPDNVVESLSILTNISLMQDQQTVALMPCEAALQFIRSGLLKAFDLGAPMQFGDIGCFYSKTRALGPAAQLFRECLYVARTESEKQEVTVPL
ncbi:LysR substrate-binding domain-containing protein [Pseudomonas sp. TH03]|uniref:LysR substrate-binding domain-containing protein n=1 Tax=Pseudomonas sp. TH03 TaxID=2796369 RepID=UPI001F5B4427|nr:LysR substrate-binding domain-containing protein [Pseudomonas sp. TH03]